MAFTPGMQLTTLGSSQPAYAAPAATDWNNPMAGLGQDVLDYLKNNQVAGTAPSGKFAGMPQIGINGNGMYVLPGGNAAFGTKGYGVVSGQGGELHYVPLNGMETNAPNYVYNPDGSYNRTEYNSHIMSPAAGVASVFGAALGFGALGAAAAGGAGAAGAAEGGSLAGSGAGFVGEGAASGIPAWDAALAGSPTLGAAGAGAGTGAGALGGAFNPGVDSQLASTQLGISGSQAAADAAAGGIPSVAGSGSTFLDALKSGASSLLGNGGGSVSATSLISPALQAIGGAYTAHEAGRAADAQVDAANAGIAENRRQFDTVRQLLAPYVTAGTDSLSGYRGLAGVDGPQAQQAAITALQGTPQFGSLVRQGEDAILQNAAATGGLRGGNTQNSLANYRTNVLSGLIDQQLGRYGSLINIGQNSAAGTGSAALTTGNNNANLMQQGGAAQAGGIVAGTNAFTNALGGIGGFASTRTWTPSATIPAAVGYGGAGMAGGGGFGTGTVYGNQDYGQYF